MLQKTPASNDSKCGRRLNNAREFESLHLRQFTASDISLAVSFLLQKPIIRSFCHSIPAPGITPKEAFEQHHNPST